MQDYTPYQKRIRECFAEAYKFLDKHKHARTQADWNEIVKDVGLNKDGDILSKLLFYACLRELEREYLEYCRKEVQINER